MKWILLPLLLASTALAATFPNLKVGDSATIDSKAALEVKSTTKGILLPRLTTTQKNAIASPTAGLEIYDSTLGVYSFYDGANWLSPITSLNALTGKTQTFTNDTNVTITSGGTAHVLGWSGQLSIGRGGTGQATKAAAYNALTPIVAKGDLAVGNGANSATNLAVGTDNYVLTADSAQATGVKWAASSGGGSSGVNFIGLTTAWAATNTTDRDAETSVGNWAAFADAASSVGPVDMTGGAPTVTISRTTTASHLLDGVGSFELVKDAANRQGEGASVVGNVPVAYQGKTATIKIPWKLLSGTLVQGDLKVFIYDVTNSTLITPFNNDVVGNLGTIYATFPMTSPASTPANIQIRVGFYFASTNTTAATVNFDMVSVGTDPPQMGMAASDWTSNLTFTPSAGFGTTTQGSYWSRREGDMMHVRGYFKCGTTAASTASIALPAGYPIDSTKYASTTNAQQVGWESRVINGASSSTWAAGANHVLFYDGSDTANIYWTRASTSNQFTKVNGSGDHVSNDGVTFEFSYPVAGWSSNVTMTQSSTFRISSYLASGSRVTASAPTALGQYRSYLRNVSANTFTETNGSPTTAPTAADGLILYQGTAWGTVNVNNNPTKYDIFVGKNKSLNFEFYKSAARTGLIDVATHEINSNTRVGWSYTYDPSTGVATIFQQSHSNETSSPQAGVDDTGAYVAANIYADIVVSENALAVGVQVPRSEVWVYANGGTSYGSVNTAIRRFGTIGKNTGSAITYADSATLGGSFTINEDGLYAINYSDRFTAAEIAGISVNSTQLTTSFEAINAADKRAISISSGSADTSNVGVVLQLSAGDVVRAHTRATAVNAATTEIMFRIVKVNN